MLEKIRYPFMAVLLVSASMELAAEPVFKTKQALGSALYFDQNLSLNRNQSCASCHAPDKGFIDNRINKTSGATSLGSDNVSLGDRNTPTASYASFIPAFEQLKSGEYRGGLFHDGRANTLQDQAAGPPLNPGEMAMPDEQAILERLLENKVYEESFAVLFDQDTLKNPQNAYLAMTESIASFEKTAIFAPFDAKYDRYLKGEYTMTEQEKLGETLFFSEQFTNCNACHQLKKMPGQSKETFSNYEYRNIGVPINKSVRKVLGKKADFIDHGLLENPAVTDIKQDGKFKTPTLRNVAVTGPYMHNGVFSDLKTVVLFYDKYNSRKKLRKINPETNQLWGEPEVAATVALEELTKGKALTDVRIDALVAFMKTLTDKKYEYLLTK
ncbi:MAG: cytochrome c peroxidase [Oceanospirillaceae bacterium]|jgi:cytochrome c peroxidase